MTTLLRWGRSAYETDDDLATERRLLDALGVDTLRWQGANPPVEEIEVLAVTSKVQVNEALLRRAKKLELVVTTTSGFEHMDTEAMAARGVQAARCPLARRDAVVDSSVGMALSLLRELGPLQRRAEAGVWARGELPQRPLGRSRGRVVGVVGGGVIGQRAAEVWRALGARVLMHDPAIEGSLALNDLLARSSVVTLHCSLTESSRQLIRQETLALMQPGALLINTARGDSVVLQDLLAATHLGGFGLDVFPIEPCPELAQLAQHPRAWLTPHAAGFYQGLGDAVAHELADTVSAHLQGRPLPHPV